MNKRLFYISVIVLGFVLVLAACSGQATTPPPVVPTEAPTQAPTAVPTVDPAEAIKPIFAASGHADAEAEAFKHWDTATPAEVPVFCAKCHSEAGFVDFIADGKVDAAVPAPQGVFTCTMCHNDTADALTSVTFPSGAVIENLGPEARCMTCHQGRESKVSLDATLAKFGEKLNPDAIPAAYKDDAGKDVKLAFLNVHYFAAGGTLYGSQVKMGYEYDGKLYDMKHQHVDGFNTCLGCHDQHSLKVKVEKCSECHQDVKTVEDLQNVREPSSAKDYDGDGNVTEGVAFEIQGLQETLLTSIQAYGKEVAGAAIVYDPAVYPYFFIDTNANGTVDEGEAVFPNAYSNWTPRLLKAAYNYQVSIKDPGAFAHGGKYIIELLYDSIDDLNSSAKLKTKLDATTLTREDAGHFDGAAAAFRHWDVDAEGKPSYVIEAACAKCHSSSALPMLIAGQTVPETGLPAGNGLMCLTCHDGANFPNRLVVKDVTMPSGKVVSFGENADSNLCISCHQGRASKKDVDDKIATFNAAADQDKVVEAIKDANGNDVKFSFINAHYLGIGAVWFGTDAQGFYEYDGKTYVGTNPHIAVDGKPGCVGCHDVHAGAPKEELCKQCHGDVAVDDIRGMSDVTDFNGNGDVKEGVRQEYRALRDVLYAEIQKYAKATVGKPILYDVDTYPYWFNDTNANGTLDDGENAFPNAYSTWTPRLLKAAFNFNFSRKNPGASVHNPKYIIQIIFDSIEDLGGDVTKFARP
jgi:hypothetical protein